MAPRVKVAVVIRLLVNDRSLRLECGRVLYERTLVHVLICGKETVWYGGRTADLGLGLWMCRWITLGVSVVEGIRRVYRL